MQEPPRQPLSPLTLALLRAAPKYQRPASSEPAEVIAERGKRKMLEQAERALDTAQTSQERTAAIVAMATALKANGLDGAPKAGPGDQPRFIVEITGGDPLEIRAKPEESGRQANVVPIVALNQART